MFSKYLIVILIAALFVPLMSKSHKMEIKVSSSAFKEGQSIPFKYTCEGENISPQISWSDFPKDTKSFVIIVDDPDAPLGTWVHWIVYNIPITVNELKEKFPKDPKFPDGIMQGTNDFRTTGYGGPCPPSGTHRYLFKVYAIDKILDVKPALTKAELLLEIEKHILAQGQLMGNYKKIRSR